MMMMKSAATSRQPKSALIAATTPRTESRIAKRRRGKHRVSARGRQQAQAGCGSLRRAAGAEPRARALRLATYSLTRVTRVAWLHVSGATDRGAVLWGS